MSTQAEFTEVTRHDKREQRERELARCQREAAARNRTIRAAEEALSSCRVMLLNTESQRRKTSMRLSQFLPLLAEANTDEQLRAIYDCVTRCCLLTEDEWPELGAEINRHRTRILGAA